MLLNRRRFLSACLSAGVGLCASPPLLSKEAAADSRRRAKYHMQFASPYRSDEADTCPHMHQQLKHNIETLSAGEIYVDVFDAGRAGTGPQLMAKVSRGLVSAALVSASNLSPVAPALDILNIPFWAAENQPYLNLITSDIWQTLVLEKVRSGGVIDVLFQYVVGPRTLTTSRQLSKPLLTLADSREIIMRVPSSAALRHLYEIAGIRSRRVDWGDVTNAIQQQTIDAMDPALLSLYSGPQNLRANIGHISYLNSVHDSWVAVINQAWLKALPMHLQEVVHEAASGTFREQIQRISVITATAEKRFIDMGVGIHQLEEQQQQEWRECCGYQHHSWLRFKQSILGDEKLFFRLLDAAQIHNGFSV